MAMPRRASTSALGRYLANRLDELGHGLAARYAKTPGFETTPTGAPRQYLTLDDAVVLNAAKSDPAGFINGLQGVVTLDEVQRLPDLFWAIKAAVDRQRQPGRFLLTGLADVLLLPCMADSLAGRMAVLSLWPLSSAELADSPGLNRADALFFWGGCFGRAPV